MNIIPDKNLFIVTSAIKSLNTRFFNHQQRFEQTITTLLSIREQVPDAIILLTECSVVQLTGREREILVNHCDMFLDLSEEPNCKHFSSNRLQNQAESALMFNTLMALNNLPILKSVKRIFKVSGRSILDVGFNLKDYDNMFGKFVFRKRIPTWMGQVHHGATDLLITRMYSMCPSLIDTYLNVIQKNMPLFNEVDYEHAHFVNIPKEYLVEFDRVYCTGWLAGNGLTESY